MATNLSFYNALSSASTRHINPGSHGDITSKGGEPVDYTRIVHSGYRVTRSPVYSSYQTVRNKNISVAE